MELLLVLLVALAFCIVNLVCVLIGVTIGVKAIARDDIKLQNPVEKARERREKKELTQEQMQEQAAIKTMLHNIDVYDGTEAGQHDVMY